MVATLRIPSFVRGCADTSSVSAGPTSVSGAIASRIAGRAGAEMSLVILYPAMLAPNGAMAFMTARDGSEGAGRTVAGRTNVAVERAEVAEEIFDTWNRLRPKLPPLPEVSRLDQLIPVDLSNHDDEVSEHSVLQAYFAGGEVARRNPGSRFNRLNGKEGGGNSL